MKKAIILALYILIVLITTYFLYTYFKDKPENNNNLPENKVNYKVEEFIYEKDLKKIDENITNYSDTSLFRYAIIEVHNFKKDTIYFMALDKRLCIEITKDFYDDNLGAAVSIANSYKVKLTPVLPNQKAYFITGLIENKSKKLLREIIKICYFEDEGYKNEITQDVLIDVPLLKPFTSIH